MVDNNGSGPNGHALQKVKFEIFMVSSKRRVINAVGYSAVRPFNVIQGRWFWDHWERMYVQLPISDPGWLLSHFWQKALRILKVKSFTEQTAEISWSWVILIKSHSVTDRRVDRRTPLPQLRQGICIAMLMSCKNIQNVISNTITRCLVASIVSVM